MLVPVLDEEHHIRDSVAAMQAQRLEGEVEFLFIDGGSIDRTGEILAQLAVEDPRVRLLCNPHRRTPNALNIGLRDARGEFVARMDAHTVYPPDYLQRGVERLSRGDVGWVSGPQLARGTNTWSRRVALALSTRLGTGGAAFRREQSGEREVDTGFTGMWRRDLLLRFGGWDEDWPVDQDYELAARIRTAGERIVCLPEMAADYIPRDSLRRLARQYWWYGYYRVKTSVRHPESMRRSHVLPPGLALTALATVAPARPVRSLARAGVTVYGLALAATSVRTWRQGASPLDSAALPAILVTMHLSCGFGFLHGCRSFGPPVAALKRIASSILPLRAPARRSAS